MAFWYHFCIKNDLKSTILRKFLRPWRVKNWWFFQGETDNVWCLFLKEKSPDLPYYVLLFNDMVPCDYNTFRSGHTSVFQQKNVYLSHSINGLYTYSIVHNGSNTLYCLVGHKTQQKLSRNHPVYKLTNVEIYLNVTLKYKCNSATQI